MRECASRGTQHSVGGSWGRNSLLSQLIEYPRLRGRGRTVPIPSRNVAQAQDIGGRQVGEDVIGRAVAYHCMKYDESLEHNLR